MAAFTHLVGDIIDFSNPVTSTTTRTKVIQSAPTGEVILDSASDQGWLNAAAVMQHIKLAYRIKTGDKLEYYSDSQQSWIDTVVTQFRELGQAGEFQVDKKVGMWLTLISPKIRFTSDLPPVPDTPPPAAKRAATDSRPIEAAMTPTATSAALTRACCLPVA